MLKAIVFDYTGVISPGPVGQWIKKNFKPGDKEYELIQQSAHEWDLGIISLPEAYERIEQATGVKANLVWDTFFEDIHTDSKVVNLIKNLKKNYKIVLFSNHAGELLRLLLKKHEIFPLFDHVIISSEHKVKKPSFDFFEKLLAETGLEKDEMVFIDDTEENVVAGNKFGIKSFQFESAEKLIKDLKKIKVELT